MKHCKTESGPSRTLNEGWGIFRIAACLGDQYDATTGQAHAGPQWPIEALAPFVVQGGTLMGLHGNPHVQMPDRKALDAA